MILNLMQKRDEAWYKPDGTPVYDINIKTARKDNLFPRVTNIIKLWPKEALDAWKLEQAILSALTLPRQPGEADDAFARRVVEDSWQQTKTTADWGTRFHELIERVMLGTDGEVDVPPDLKPHFDAWKPWFTSTVTEVVAIEQVVVSHVYGFAGRLDHLFRVNGEVTLADTKTRSVKNGKPAWYDEQAMQLAAYSRCLPTMRLPLPNKFMSVVVNRDKPEPPYVKVWDQDEIELGWNRFRACFEVWKLVKKYEPRGGAGGAKGEGEAA